MENTYDNKLSEELSSMAVQTGPPDHQPQSPSNKNTTKVKFTIILLGSLATVLGVIILLGNLFLKEQMVANIKDSGSVISSPSPTLSNNPAAPTNQFLMKLSSNLVTLNGCLSHSPYKV